MKAKRRIITGIASGCAVALGKPAEGALADYELLELIFFARLPRRDVKPLAKSLIARFGSFAEVIAADFGRLAEIDGMSAGVIWSSRSSRPPRNASPRARSRSGFRWARGAR